MALASEGIEHAQLVMYNSSFGLSSQSVLEYFTGGAYLPWLRMGNIHSFGGPMTAKFFESRYLLQQQILERMRELDISFILPAFDGHVPNAFFTKYQFEANFTRSGDWNAFGAAFSENYILDPSSDLFQQVAAAWMRTSVKLFGPAAFYSADTWNENVPPSEDSAFLAESAAAVIRGIRTSVPNASWVMQGWLFASDRMFWTPSRAEAYLSGVPIGQLLILDLEADIHPVASWTGGFFGHDFLWCALHNFGGRRGIYGNVPSMVNASAATLANYSNAVGIGITMEATEQNFFVYETVLESAWLTRSAETSIASFGLDLQQWVEIYARSRLPPGGGNRNASGWLRDLVFSNGGAYTVQPDIGCCIHFTDLDHFPWFDTVSNQWWGTFTNYSADTILNSTKKLSLLLEDDDDSSMPLHFDVCDVARQFVSNVFTDLHRALYGAITYGTAAVRDAPRSASVSEKYLEPLLANLLGIILSLDDLVGSNENFLFGRWQAAALRLGLNNSAQAAVLDFNAKNIVTMYGPDGFGSDYASKPWAGLLREYHHVRWSYFASWVLAAYSNSSSLPTSYPPFLPEVFFAELEINVDAPFTRNVSQTFPEAVNGLKLGHLVREYLRNFSDPTTSSFTERCTMSRRHSVKVPNATVLWTAWHDDDGVRAQMCRLAWPSCVGYLPQSGKMLFSIGAVVELDAVASEDGTGGAEDLVEISCK